MPNPTSISQYPSQWIDLIRTVSINGRTITVSQLAGKPLTKAQAAQMRFRFYAIRGLLRKDPQQHDLYALSESIQVNLVLVGLSEHLAGEAWAVVFSPRDKNAEALALQSAMEVSNV